MVFRFSFCVGRRRALEEALGDHKTNAASIYSRVERLHCILGGWQKQI